MGQGLAAARRLSAPRDAQRVDPRRDDDRHPGGGTPRRLGHHRDDLCVAGCGPRDHPGGAGQRFSRGAGGRDARRLHLRRHQPGGGSDVRHARSAHPHRALNGEPAGEKLPVRHHPQQIGHVRLGVPAALRPHGTARALDRAVRPGQDRPRASDDGARAVTAGAGRACVRHRPARPRHPEPPYCGQPRHARSGGAGRGRGRGRRCAGRPVRRLLRQMGRPDPDAPCRRATVLSSDAARHSHRRGARSQPPQPDHGPGADDMGALRAHRARRSAVTART